MDDDERNRTFDALLAALEESGLGWVADQVTEQVRLGYTVEREIETLKESRVERGLFDQDEYLFAVKCKFYSTPLQLHLARAFMGLTQDLSADETFFVTNSNSRTLEKLLSARGRDWEHRLTPTSPNNVLRLRHKFQSAFQVFKAK